MYSGNEILVATVKRSLSWLGCVPFASLSRRSARAARLIHLSVTGSCLKRQRRKRQSVTAKREKSQTPKVLIAILTLPNLT